MTQEQSLNPEWRTLLVHLPLARCPKHGIHKKQEFFVSGADQVKGIGYCFCPYCAGEALSRAFPVEDAEGGSPDSA